MFNGITGRRVAPLAERRVALRLREALAALPAPWVVLANRRPSGADGPPWVRFLALHPDQGIALVDTGSPEAAVAPLEDFLARTGFPALRAGALPIVPVAVGAGEIGVVGDLLAAALAPVQGTIGNPNWCEAVVELLLAAPDLMLVQLRRAPSAERHPITAEPAPARPPSRPSSEPKVRAEPPPQRPSQAPKAAPPRAAQPELPRLVPRQLPAEPSDEDVRLVPRRVAPTPPSPSMAPPDEATLRFDDKGDEPRRASAEPARAEPHFAGRAEPQFSLEAGEPVIPLRPTGAGRRHEPSLRTGALRPDSGLTDWRPRRRRHWPYAAAAGVLLLAVGAIAAWYRAGPSPVQTAATGTALPTPPQTPTAMPTPSAPTPAATAPSPPPAPPPVHAAAAPPPAPHATAADLPRAMLQPKIAAVPPPLPPDLPAVKLTPTRTAAAPAAKPARTAAVKPAPAPKAPGEDALPPAIEAVLHPQAAPPAPSTASVPPSAPQPAAAPPTAASAAPSAGSLAPPGGTVTVNGVSYVNGEQPHSLGTLGTSAPASAPTPAPAPATAPTPALASNGPVATAPASSPREVVISRAPSTPVTAPAAPPSASSGAGAPVANGPPREVVISHAPSVGTQPSGNAPPSEATGAPQSIQAAPLSGNSP
ncbi:MAG: hypothetical protein KGJ66_10055 [Alphaproteobacteria bacterium]|nr:hypothetical protein [Alphaproteobacteria bacterium]